MASFDFEGAKAKGLDEARIRTYLRNKGREGEADAYFGAKPSPKLKNNAQQEQKKGFLSTIGGFLKETASDAVEAGKGIVDDITERSDEVNRGISDMVRGKQNIAETAFQVIGNAGGGVGDIASRLTTGALKVAAPQAVEDAVGGAVEKGVSAVTEMSIPKTILENYRKLEEEDPAFARDIDAALGIGGFLATAFGGVKAGPPAATATKTVQGGIKEFIESRATGAAGSFERAAARADKVIDDTMSKAIKPSSRGKSTVADLDKYKTNSRTAVKDIFTNRDKLSLADDLGNPVALPETPGQFSRAISQTKKALYDEYAPMFKAADDAGLQVPTTKAADNLRAVLDDPLVRDFDPEIKSYIERNIKSLDEKGVYSVVEGQRLVEGLNRRLDDFYSSAAKTPDMGTRAAIDEKMLSGLRDALDETVQSLPENAQFSAFKKRYGALRSIEQDVTRRAITASRQNVKGLIDYADILNNGQLLGGLLTGNPLSAIQGGVGKLITNYYKHLNSTDAQIKNMFKELEKLANDAAKKGVNLEGVPLPPQ